MYVKHYQERTCVRASAFRRSESRARGNAPLTSASWPAAQRTVRTSSPVPLPPHQVEAGAEGEPAAASSWPRGSPRPAHGNWGGVPEIILTILPSPRQLLDHVTKILRRWRGSPGSLRRGMRDPDSPAKLGRAGSRAPAGRRPPAARLRRAREVRVPEGPGPVGQLARVVVRAPGAWQPAGAPGQAAWGRAVSRGRAGKPARGPGDTPVARLAAVGRRHRRHRWRGRPGRAPRGRFDVGRRQRRRRGDGHRRWHRRQRGRAGRRRNATHGLERLEHLRLQRQRGPDQGRPPTPWSRAACRPPATSTSTSTTAG